MIKSSESIIMEILGFIYREGGSPKTWYIGVARDPRQRLFDEHRLNYQNDAWIYRTAKSESEALHVQAYFLEFGLDDCEEGWQSGACAVYAYRKNTDPFIKTWRRAAEGRGKGHRPQRLCIISALESGGAPKTQSKREDRKAIPGQ